MATGARSKQIYQALGLYSLANQFSAPEGAMITALDVVVDRPGIVESRYAYKAGEASVSALSSLVGGIQAALPDSDVNSGTNVVFVNTGIVGGVAGRMGSVQVERAAGAQTLTQGYLSANNEVRQANPSGAFQSMGLEIFSAFRANGNNYLCTGGKVGSYACPSIAGIPQNLKRVDDYGPTTAPYQVARSSGAGMPEGLTPVDYTGTAGSGLTGLPTASGKILAGGLITGSTSFYNTGGQVAYRVVYATKDRQLNLVRGAPSGRHIVYSAGAYTFGLIIPLPCAVSGGLVGTNSQLFAGDIIQVYRSEIAPAVAGSEPSDIMAQVYEYVLQSSDLNAGYITFQDSVASAYGPSLYTNDTQEGILAAEARPPTATLGVYHKNVAWYAGVGAKVNAAVLTILGVDLWAVPTTTIVVDGVTYTAAAAEDLPNKKFKLSTSGSASQNIADTARSLARAISWQNTSVYAYYATPANSIQFQIVIKNLVQGDYTPKTITSATIPAGTVSPALPLNTKEDSKTSRLYFSKPNQPEAVPDLNYVSVGAPEVGITGLASLRDSLFVFKPDGLYRVTGTTANDMRVELFDGTISMPAGLFKSIARAGNQVFAACTTGFVSITESNVQLISRPIDNLVANYSAQPTPLGNGNYRLPFTVIGAATEIGRKYIALCTDTWGLNGAGAGAQIIYVYNFIQKSWVSWTSPSYCSGIVDNIVNDQGVEYISLFSGSTLTSKVYPITYTAAGFTLQGSGSFAYCVEDNENPGLLKRFYDIRLILNGSSGLGSISINFTSDSGASPVSVTQTVAAGQLSALIEVPRAHSEATQLSFTVTAPASGQMIVQSCIVNYDMMSDRMPQSRG